MAETVGLTAELRPQPPDGRAPLLLLAGLIASVLLHASVLGALTYVPVVPKEAERTAPITVDLVAPPEEPKKEEPEPPKKEPEKLDLPELKPQLEQNPPAQQPPAPPKPPTPKPQAQKPPPRPAQQPPQQQPPQQQPPPQQPPSAMPAQPTAAPLSPPMPAETPAEAAQRLAELFHAEDMLPQIGGTPAEQAAKITPLELQKFVAHLSSCWKPQGVADDAPNLKVVLRLNLLPNGRLRGEPDLIAATFSAQGPALVASAKQAVAKCQPYAMLPADRYSEWRMLDLTFTPRGLHIGGVQQ